MGRQGVESVDTISVQTDVAGVQHWLNTQAIGVPGEVAQFLATHSFLLPLLDEAHGKIARYFGNASYSYSLFTNPEDGAAATKLVLSIHPLVPPAEALAAYHSLQHAWWTPNVARSRGALMLAPEYL